MTPDRTPDAVAALLRARAQAAARPLDRGQDLPHAGIEVLEFRLATERYGVETRHVREVHPLRNLTPVPCTPPFILGIVNVRGQVVTVLSLKRFFGLPEQGITDMHRIVRVDNGRGDDGIGLLADMAVNVYRVPRETLRPSLPTPGGIGARYVQGVTADGLVVLDIGRVLSDPRLLVDEEPRADAGDPPSHG